METPQKRSLIRCIVFLIILVCIVGYLMCVFSYPETSGSAHIFNTFYNEEENSLDGVYLGASSSYRFWIAPMAYKQHGYALTSLATAGQTLTLSRYLMEEVEKTQNPKLYVIELRSTYKTASSMTDALIRRVTDNMKPSLTRRKAIDYSLEYASHGENDVTDPLDYYFPIIKYHERWDGELTKEDIMLTELENPCKGFILTKHAFIQNSQSAASFTREIVPLDPHTEQVLTELLDYCDSIDAEVLFVLSPYSATEKMVVKLNAAAALVESRGYPVLNFNSREMVDEVGINYNTDFYDNRHTNSMGAEKYTTWLASYIAENYDLEDHRGQAGYESWEESFQNYDDYVREKRETMLRE